LHKFVIVTKFTKCNKNGYKSDRAGPQIRLIVTFKVFI